MADPLPTRTVRVGAPPPASDVVAPESVDDTLIEPQGVDLGRVGRPGSITAGLFPFGNVQTLMFDGQVNASNIIEAFTIVNRLLADGSVDARALDLENAEWWLTLLSRVAVVESDIRSITANPTGGEDALQFIAGPGIRIGRNGATVKITATGEAAAEGSLTGVNIEALTPVSAGDTIRRPFRFTFLREGSAPLTADMTVLDVSGGGSGSGTGTRTYGLALSGRTLRLVQDGSADSVTLPASGGTADGTVDSVTLTFDANTQRLTLRVGRTVGSDLTSTITIPYPEAAGGGGGSGGLTRAQVDSRIEALVPAWARQPNPPTSGADLSQVQPWARIGNTAVIPLTKILGAVDTRFRSLTGVSEVNGAAFIRRIQEIINPAHIAAWFRTRVKGAR